MHAEAFVDVGAPCFHSRIPRRGAYAYTLIDLVVTTTIAGLLLVVLIPAARNAERQSRDLVCAATLGEFGAAMQAYAVEHQDWIPGVNTSGLTTRLLALTNPEELQAGDVPVQSYDWMTPLWPYMRDEALPAVRAQRWQTLWTEFKCPSMKWEYDILYGEADDYDDFLENMPPGCSYLSPAAFAYWGGSHEGEILAEGTTPSGRPVVVLARTASDFFSVQPPVEYTSRLSEAGAMEDKIFAADGFRYVNPDRILDFDVQPDPVWFGVFTTSGGWNPISNAYGVIQDSENWDGDIISQGNYAQGHNLPLTYRHGSPEPLTPADCLSTPLGGQTCRGNKGGLNGLFFDGHVTLMSDQQSRPIDMWYPAGSIVQNDPVGMTTSSPGYEIP